MSCVGIVVKKPGDFSAALEEALSATKPVVLDVRTHLEGIAPLRLAAH